MSTLLSLPPTHSHSHCQVFISGGHGLEDINKARACDNVSETEGCLLFWYLLSTSNTQQLNYYYDRKLPHMIVTWLMVFYCTLVSHDCHMTIIILCVL